MPYFNYVCFQSVLVKDKPHFNHQIHSFATLIIAACSAHCVTYGCNVTGAAKCDRCDSGYGLNSAGACDGMTIKTFHAVLKTNYNV